MDGRRLENYNKQQEALNWELELIGHSEMAEEEKAKRIKEINDELWVLIQKQHAEQLRLEEDSYAKSIANLVKWVDDQAKLVKNLMDIWTGAMTIINKVISLFGAGGGAANIAGAVAGAGTGAGGLAGALSGLGGAAASAGSAIASAASAVAGAIAPWLAAAGVVTAFLGGVALLYKWNNSRYDEDVWEYEWNADKQTWEPPGTLSPEEQRTQQNAATVAANLALEAEQASYHAPQESPMTSARVRTAGSDVYETPQEHVNRVNAEYQAQADKAAAEEWANATHDGPGAWSAGTDSAFDIVKLWLDNYEKGSCEMTEIVMNAMKEIGLDWQQYMTGTKESLNQATQVSANVQEVIGSGTGDTSAYDEEIRRDYEWRLRSAQEEQARQVAYAKQQEDQHQRNIANEEARRAERARCDTLWAKGEQILAQSRIDDQAKADKRRQDYADCEKRAAQAQESAWARYNNANEAAGQVRIQGIEDAIGVYTEQYESEKTHWNNIKERAQAYYLSEISKQEEINQRNEEKAAVEIDSIKSGIDRIKVQWANEALAGQEAQKYNDQLYAERKIKAEETLQHARTAAETDIQGYKDSIARVQQGWQSEAINFATATAYTEQLYADRKSRAEVISQAVEEAASTELQGYQDKISALKIAWDIRQGQYQEVQKANDQLYAQEIAQFQQVAQASANAANASIRTYADSIQNAKEALNRYDIPVTYGPNQQALGDEHRKAIAEWQKEIEDLRWRATVASHGAMLEEDRKRILDEIAQKSWELEFKVHEENIKLQEDIKSQQESDRRAAWEKASEQAKIAEMEVELARQKKAEQDRIAGEELHLAEIEMKRRAAALQIAEAMQKEQEAYDAEIKRVNAQLQDSERKLKQLKINNTDALTAIEQEGMAELKKIKNEQGQIEATHAKELQEWNGELEYKERALQAVIASGTEIITALERERIARANAISINRTSADQQQEKQLKEWTQVIESQEKALSDMRINGTDAIAGIEKKRLEASEYYAQTRIADDAKFNEQTNAWRDALEEQERIKHDLQMQLVMNEQQAAREALGAYYGGSRYIPDTPDSNYNTGPPITINVANMVADQYGIDQLAQLIMQAMQRAGYDLRK